MKDKRKITTRQPWSKPLVKRLVSGSARGAFNSPNGDVGSVS